MSARTRRLAAVTALTVAGTTAVVLGTTGAPASAGADRQQQLAEARRASAKFHDVADAERAGYVRVSPCEASAAGGMGYHYLKEANVGSTDPRRPAVLLYAPSPSGKLRLTGVEYLVFAEDQTKKTDADRPYMFNGVAFDGPMDGHGGGMPVHYDLHVWLWQNNSNGVFAQWNPSVTCPPH